MNKKVLKSKLYYLVILLAFGFLVWKVKSDWFIVLSFTWKFNLINLVIAIFISFIAYLFNVFSWHLLTKVLFLHISFRDNLKIWTFSNLTRFIPGKIWQYPSRILLLSEKKVNNFVSGAATVIEILLNFSSASIVICLSFLLWKFPKELTNHYLLLFILMSVPIFIIFLFNKKSLNFFGQLFRKITHRKITGLEKIKISYFKIFPLLIIFALRFCITSTFLLFLIKSFVQISFVNYIFILGVSTFSWLLGYLSFFSPAGLGVAEISLATLLSSIIPFSVGSIIAIVFRLITLITELVLIGFQLVFYRK